MDEIVDGEKRERESEEGTQTNPVGLYHVEINREGRTSKRNGEKKYPAKLKGNRTRWHRDQEKRKSRRRKLPL